MVNSTTRSMRTLSSNIWNMASSSIHTAHVYNSKVKLKKIKKAPDLPSTPAKSSKAALCPIMECQDYKNIRQKLDKDSVIDTLVTCILTMNITVYKIPLDNNNISVFVSATKNLKRAMLPKVLDSELKVGNYSIAEDKAIEENWKILIEKIGIEEKEAIAELFLSTSDDKDIGLKLNTVGYFLSQGLSKVRLATDVFHRAKLLKCLKTGEFSSEEDKIILDFVGEEGRAWPELSRILMRLESSVCLRYSRLVSQDNTKHGAYTVDEDEEILTDVFALNKNILGEGKISKQDWEKIAKKLQRSPVSVFGHWRNGLEPKLKRYHAGTLHKDMKVVLINHMVEHGMEYAQDVDWKKLFKLDKFAGTTSAFLSRDYQNLKHLTAKKNPDLSSEQITADVIQRYLDNSHRRGTPAKNKDYQDQLISFYKRNILQN